MTELHNHRVAKPHAPVDSDPSSLTLTGGSTEDVGCCPASITSLIQQEWQPLPIGDYQMGAVPKRQTGRLARLGLNPEEYCWFQDLFVGDLWNYGRTVRGGEWSSAKQTWRLSHSQLIGHLEGKFDISTYCRRVKQPGCPSRYATDRFTIDLDFQNDPSDLYARYDRMVSVFGTPTLLFRSSASGGLHVHYWLDQQVHLQRLRSADGQRGLLPRLLATQGLHAENGRIELYPQACYKDLRRGNRLRVPFGVGSRLLDCETLLPLSGHSRTHPSNISDLQLVRERALSGDIEPVSFDALFDASKSAPKPSSVRSSRSSGSGRAAPTEHDGPSAALLLEQGLSGPGQLDGAIGALAYHYWRENASEELAIEYIGLWLDEKNNGQSTTYNLRRRQTDRTIRDRVTRVFAQRRNRAHRAWAQTPGLSGWEAARILEATSCGCDVDSGEVVDLYPLQRLCFEVTKSAKQWVLTEGQAVWDSLVTSNSRFTSADEGCTHTLLSHCTRFWPSPSTFSFVVDIPFEHRLRCGGVSRGRLPKFWKVAKASRLFQLTRKAQRELHRCEAYLVQLDFSTRSAALFENVDQMIALQVPREEREQRYTDYRCRKLAQIECQNAMVAAISAPVNSFEQFLRERLNAHRIEPIQMGEAA
jgi:hypothetical protein